MAPPSGGLSTGAMLAGVASLSAAAYSTSYPGIQNVTGNVSLNNNDTTGTIFTDPTNLSVPLSTSHAPAITSLATAASDSQQMILFHAMMDLTTASSRYGSDMEAFPSNWTSGVDCRNATNLTNCVVDVAMTTPYHDFYTTARFVTGLICYPIICAYGLLGNVFILIVFAQKSMYTSTNVYLSALAVSDIVKLVNDSLYFLTILLYETSPAAGNKAFGYLYPYAHFIFNMSVCVSSWLTVSVAVERYLLVCHPIKSKTLTTLPRAKLISMTCFVVMTAVAVPSALRYHTVEEIISKDGKNATILDVKVTKLWEDKQFVLAYNWLQSLLRSIIPLFVLVVMNGFIINALRQTRANKKMASKNKITIMLCIVIICFLVCIIPDAIMSSFFNLGYVESDNYLVKGVREITDMLLAVNAAINFLLYIIFNKIFRDQFVALFCGRCVKKRNPDDPKYRRLSEGKSQANGVNRNAKSAKCSKVESTKV